MTKGIGSHYVFSICPQPSVVGRGALGLTFGMRKEAASVHSALAASSLHLSSKIRKAVVEGETKINQRCYESPSQYPVILNE